MHFAQYSRAFVCALSILAAVPLIAPAQQSRTSADSVPLKNWPVPRLADKDATAIAHDASAGGPPLVFIAIYPCRVLDTRSQGGSGLTGAFGPPSLVANQPRVIPVPSSNCGVPVAAAYSMNFVSITPPGQAVGYVSAWQDDKPWPGTVVLNALQGGMVDGAANVPAGTDGGSRSWPTTTAIW